MDERVYQKVRLESFVFVSEIYSFPSKGIVWGVGGLVSKTEN